jgi:hypothetical protein
MPDNGSLLPDSRAREAKGVVSVKGTNFVPIFCANCGGPGGGVPVEHMTFAFFLCDPCCEKWGPIAGVMSVPEEVFWEKVKQEQLDSHGRLLSNAEIVREIDDAESTLSKLVREAPKGR